MKRLFGTPSTEGIMATVLIALIPAIATSTLVFGPGVLLNLVAASLAAWAAESLCLWSRGRAVGPRLLDHSALLTGWLLALALPPAAPWWLVAAAVASAVMLGKQLYGGLGHNPLNPAMLGYCLVLVSAPIEMTTLWIDPLAAHGLRKAWSAWLGHTSDATTGATVLTLYRQDFAALTATEIAAHPIHANSALGLVAGMEWVALAYLVGGLFLLQQRIISWHAPLGFLAGLVVPLAMFGIDPDVGTPLGVHLATGSTLFAAFFILTDPVSGATSPRGRLVFGTGVGLLTALIRTQGQFPDGVAFAVLLMNFAVPLIDHYTRPRVIGRAASIKGSGGLQ